MLYAALREQYPEYDGMGDTERYALAWQLLLLLQEDIDDATRRDLEQRVLFLHGRLALHVFQQARHRFFTNPRIDDHDVEQAAFEGLLLAIRGFDPTMGTQFSSYAIKAIQARINALEQEVGLDLQISHAALGLLNQARKKLQDEETIDERLTEEADKEGFWTENTVKKLLQAFKTKIVSLFTRTHDGRRTLEMIIPDESMSLEDMVVNEAQNTYYEQRLRQFLNEMEFDIFARYYGLFGYEPITYREIGKLYGISKQAVHQLLRDRILPRVRNVLGEELGDYR